MREYDNLRDELSRRQYAQPVAGIGAAGLAGCPSQSGSGAPTESGPTETPTEAPAGAGDDSTASPTDEPADTETDEPTPTGDPVTDTIRIFQANSPEVFDANVWAPQDGTTGMAFMTDLHALANVHTGQMAYSGVEIETPWKPGTDSVSIMTWFTGYEVDAPYDVYETHDERTTYWNGDPMDAEARETHTHVHYFQNGNKFAEDTSYREEATSQWEYHWWEPDGSGALADDPTARHILESQAAPNDGDMPLHPDFTTPYLERYRDASSTDQASSVTDDLTSDRIPLRRLHEEGRGAGPYEITSTDDIGSARLTLHARADHPNTGNTNVQRLAIMWGEGDRRQTLATNGALDLNGNIVAPNGLYSWETLPDHMQELTRWMRSSGGDKWRLNWNGAHLGNLWARRALAAAVDWNAVGSNVWGQERSVPLEHHTYMLDAQSQALFSGEFLDSLHAWPMESDVETAAEYMRRAGYSKQGNQWVDRSGNPASTDLVATSAIQDHVGAAQTIRANLANFGFDVNFTTQGWSSWTNNLTAENGLNYDFSLFWHGYPNPFGYYNSTPGWWSGTLVMGKADAPTQPVDADTEMDSQGKPLQVDLPTEVGSIEAPDEAGKRPELSDGRTINLAEVVQQIREPGQSEQQVQDFYRTCAQYYNYYLPHFVFHQYNWGAWGNVRDFDWPDPAHEGLDWERGFGISAALVLGGLVEASYDTEYPAPE